MDMGPEPSQTAARGAVTWTWGGSGGLTSQVRLQVVAEAGEEVARKEERLAPLRAASFQELRAASEEVGAGGQDLRRAVQHLHDGLRGRGRAEEESNADISSEKSGMTAPYVRGTHSCGCPIIGLYPVFISLNRVILS